MNNQARKWLKVIEERKFNADDGLWLEELVCDLGHQIPEWDFVRVMHWSEWQDRDKYFPGVKPNDIGIDSVGVRPDQSLVAIQCKARSADRDLVKRDVESFLSAIGSDIWSECWIVSNVKFSAKVEQIVLGLHNERPFKLVDFVEPVRQLALSETGSYMDDPELTSMQDEAVANTVKYLKEHAQLGRVDWNFGESRGHIVMPCGTGKTRVAYRVMKKLVKSNQLVIVLVPSIALVSQIKREFQKMAKRDDLDMRTLAICSDSTAGIASTSTDENRVSIEKDRTADTGFVRSYEVVGATASNEGQVKDWLSEHTNCGSVMALFSTYQSAHHTAGGLNKLGLTAKLVIADEAHRTAGIRKISPSNPRLQERIRNFTLCHDKDRFPATYRLYQTATPRIYGKSTISEIDPRWEVRSMNDEATFGPELFRLSYRDAVERNLLSDYRIIAWAIGDSESKDATRIAEQLNKEANDQNSEKPKWTTALAMRALTMAAFLAGVLPNTQIKSMIAFCNRTKYSSDLVNAIQSQPVREWVAKYFEIQGLDVVPNLYKVAHVDASHATTVRNEVLNDLSTATIDSPFAISNVGIFGEGTDSPDLSAVAFLQPRKSPVDVIQAVGRVMRKSPNKSIGYILVPVVIPPNCDPEHFLKSSSPEEGWQELGQILQALRAHDGRIENQLQDLIEIYLPSQQGETREHLLIVEESRNQTRVFKKTTRVRDIENIIAPRNEDDSSDVLERLHKSEGDLHEIIDIEEFDEAVPPSTVTAVRVKRDGTPRVEKYLYTPVEDLKLGDSSGSLWQPDATIETGKKIIKDDKRGRGRMRTPKRNGVSSQLLRQEKVGSNIVKLGGLKLIESDLHLNLLEKSGLMPGPSRDLNLIRETVNAVAFLLRSEGLENTLAKELHMTQIRARNTGAADACAVTAVIWVNAAIMHARLSDSNLPELRSVPSLEKAICETNPAKGIMQAWQEILACDYRPIFKIALDLLTEIAFDHRAGVFDALRRTAKDATFLAGQYADMGMDHAGELFNKVMGNQQSDGAFFTRPIAAAMLSELVLYATRENDWLDESTWENIRCFDPACGSGTLLIAMLNAIKIRIRKAGGNDQILHKFHRKAVEELLLGMDINEVSLQLAACQFMIGNMNVKYDRLNLHKMSYGGDGSKPDLTSVRTGSVEVLRDPTIAKYDRILEEMDYPSENIQLSLQSCGGGGRP